jgi:hypothetical protein
VLDLQFEKDSSKNSSMTDVFVTIRGKLFGQPTDLKIQVAGGPLSIQLAPENPVPLIGIWNAISDEMQSLIGIGLPDITSGLWAKFLHIDPATAVEPTLWFTASKAKESAFAVFVELQLSPAIRIGDGAGVGDLKIILEPRIDIWSLYLGYTQGQGLDLRAKISIPTTPAGKQLGAPPPGEKFEIVTYPFPVPAQNSVGVFQLKYLGLGQRVGPTVVVTGNDPMATIFDQLEHELVGDDPATILTHLARDFYQPDRDWFIAADLAFRGWELRVIFNDPTLYGLELTATMPPFNGLLFEILYQKLGPNLGVYYGALTLPYFLRRIVLEGIILILPGFSIWVYTNGDFKINIGWPIGETSIGIQVGILNGIAGFYFAKLRSADNPGAQAGPEYDLILEFGIGISVFVHESFNSGIFSATLDVNVTATFQGLLAWLTGDVTSGPPNHYWFAGTAGLAVLLQGSIDFAILKASVTVSLIANATVAFETGYLTIIAVSAAVDVEVSIKIIFFTIHLSFSTRVSAQFTIGSGTTPASVNGPLAPGLSAFAPSPAIQALRDEARQAAGRMIRKFIGPVPRVSPLVQAWPFLRTGSPPLTIQLYFGLQPTAVYEVNRSSIDLIASLFIASPDPQTPFSQDSDFARLLIAIVKWLLWNYSTHGEPWSARLQTVSEALGSGSEPPGPAFGGWHGFAAKFRQFLEREIVFQISDINSGSPSRLKTAAVLPVFEELQLSYLSSGGPRTINFDSYNLTPPDYPEIVNKYFKDLHWYAPDRLSMAQAKAGANSPENGPSMASYLFYDYYLLQSRNAIRDLLKLAADYEQKAEKEYLTRVESIHAAWPIDQWALVDTVADYGERISGESELDALLEKLNYASAAGLGSRYLLNGLQLPDPDFSTVISRFIFQNMAAVPTSGISELTGQQFSVPAGVNTASATLSLSPASGTSANWILFDSGSPGSVTSSIDLPSEVPPQPLPQWVGATGSPSGPGEGTIQLSPLAPIVAHPTYFTGKNQIFWNAPEGPRTILPLPQPVMAIAKKRDGINLEISTQPPPDTLGPPAGSSPDVTFPGTPGLLIRITISQVLAQGTSNIAPSGSPAGGSPPGSGGAARYLPFVYQVSGTDEATRDLIYDALLADLPVSSIHLMYTPPGSGNLQSESLSPNVLIAKTNLSTLNQLPEVSPRFAVLSQALALQDVNFAPISDIKGFLRLLWEVSVVNAPGFFLFYLTSDGQDLPAALFSDGGTAGGQSAEFDILVQFGAQAVDLIPIARQHNCIWIDGRPPVGGTLFAALLDDDGMPVPQYSPGYPAGHIGFEIDWALSTPSPEPPIPVDRLYQMIQFSILPQSGYTESIWSLPVGPTKSGSSNELTNLASPGNPIWRYQQTVPIYRFVDLSPADRNRYCATGKPAQLGFRLIDVYGNALPNTRESTFTPLYQDPLVSIGQWPGVYVDYHFRHLADSAAGLEISISFDPDSVVPHGGFGPPSSPPGPPQASTRQLWVSALERYGLILDQLEDPNTKISVSTTLTGGAVGEEESIRDRLQEFVRSVEAQIRSAIATSSPPDASPGWVAQPVVRSIELSVPFAKVVALPVDIVPVSVSVAFSRPEELVFPPAISKAPATQSVSFAVQPNQHLLDTGSPFASPAQGSAIRTFAKYFEHAFENFDGGSGVLKLAQRAGVHTGEGASAVAELWAVRWSETAGISIDLEDRLVYFALRPLRTQPITREVEGTTYANVDLDAWAQEFLSNVDAFLTPKNAIAIALLDERNGTSYFNQILDLKARLARAIPDGLAPVLAPQEHEGNLAAAQEQLEQALLTSLSAAFSVSVIAQIPALVRMVGKAEEAPSPSLKPPQLFGSVGPPLAASSPANEGSPAAVSKQYTISNGELDIASGRQWITTLVSVAQAKAQSELELPLEYQVSYIQHEFEPGKKYEGYIPSSWLKFALPDSRHLTMPITRGGVVHIPIPLAFYPEAPVLMGQTASAAILASPGSSSPSGIRHEIAEALEWTYGATIGHDWAHQDKLFFNVTYNLPVSSHRDASFVASRDPALDLFDALAGFRKDYAFISPDLGAISLEAYPNGPCPASPHTADQLLQTFVKAVGGVASAWERMWKGSLRPMEAAATGEIIVDHYAMELDSVKDSLIHLFASADDQKNPRYWPEITTADGQSWQPDRSQAEAPASPGQWWTLSHQFRPGADFSKIILRWTPLDVLERQTATLNANIVRNADLLGDLGIATNEAFIYRTQIVWFSNPVIPLIQRGALQAVQPEKTLVQTIEDILEPIVGIGRNLNPLLRIGAGYSFELGSNPSGTGLRSVSAILLADDVNLGVAGSPIDAVAAGIGAEIGQWHLSTQPSASGALLNMSLGLFGTVQGQRLPLVQIQQIPILVDSVSQDWWSSAGN